ncbi:MAG: hypothetical protein HOP29_10525 [Phycisphaerales bacterium]|nr:hypothetical protein [Phycisphaerales bacterium]
MLLVPVASAGGPGTLHHQGAVTVNGNRFTGDGAFRFALVDPATNNYFWVNDGGAIAHPDAPVNAVTLTVLNGVYDVALGDDSLTNMTPIPGGIFNENGNLALRVWFDDLDGGGLHRLLPDLPLSTAPYSGVADSAERLTIPGSDTPAATINAAGKVTIPAAFAVNGAVSGPGFNGWDTNASNDVLTSTNFGGDVSGTFDAIQVSDNIGIDNGRLFAPTGAGSVGIGTTTPLARLEVRDNVNTAVQIHSNTGQAELQLVSNSSGVVSVYSPSATNDLRLFAGGADVLSIRSNGNVGVGTTTSAARLQVAGGAIMPSIGSNATSGIYFPPNPGGGAGDEAYIRYYAVSGDNSVLDLGIGDDAADKVRFINGSTVSMVIANGNVGIGTENPTEPLHIYSSVPGNGWQVRVANSLQPDYEAGIRVHKDGWFDIDSQIDGGTGFARLNNAGSWTVVSDARLKTDVHPLSGILEKAMALNPVSFRFKEAVTTQGDAAPTEIGFLAQDVRELFPSLVVNGSDLLTMNYAGLSVVAIAALQEQQAQIAAQGSQLLAERTRLTGHQTEIDRLRRENEDLRARLDRLESTMADRVAAAGSAPAP